MFLGVLFTLTLSIFARFAHGFIPSTLQKGISEVLIGIFIGLIVNQIFSDHPQKKSIQPGIKFCFDKLLKFAIVLLGLRITVGTLQSIGLSTLILIIFLIVLAILITNLLGKFTGTPKKLATLIGIGAAVCGNTAISATAPAIKASDEEMSFALATNTLFGTLAVFLYPFLGQALGLSDEFFGIWAGTAVNDTSQVVATGFSFSNQAGEIATTVKLVRNSLMGFVIIAVTMLFGTNDEESKKVPFIKRIKIPGFVLIFIFVAILNSFGLFTFIEEKIGLNYISFLKSVTKFFILMALTGVGLNTKFANLKKIGLTPLFIGLACGAILSITSFLSIKYLILS